MQVQGIKAWADIDSPFFLAERFLACRCVFSSAGCLDTHRASVCGKAPPVGVAAGRKAGVHKV
jgi:hypothetical protein